MTPAQRNALQWIAAGKVVRYYPWNPGRREAPARWKFLDGTPPTGTLPRRSTIDQCVHMKRAEVGESINFVTRRVVLTDAGREELAK